LDVGSAGASCTGFAQAGDGFAIRFPMLWKLRLSKDYINITLFAGVTDLNYADKFDANLSVDGRGSHPHERADVETIAKHASHVPAGAIIEPGILYPSIIFSRERIMYLHTIIVLAFVSLASGFLPCPAQAQGDPAQSAVQNGASSPIGKVVAATGSVTIEHVSAVVVQANLPNQAGQTKVGDAVYQGDVVRTGSDGRVSINFADDTSFNLSNNANMTLDEFVYDPNGKSNSTVFNLGKGAFTFVAGKIAKNGDMKVETPVATMGIRGTTPHVEILEDGTAKFTTLIEEGKSQVVKKLGAPAAEQPQQTPDQKLNLKICRGC
jgi:FecR protein